MSEPDNAKKMRLNVARSENETAGARDERTENRDHAGDEARDEDKENLSHEKILQKKILKNKSEEEEEEEQQQQQQHQHENHQQQSHAEPTVGPKAVDRLTVRKEYLSAPLKACEGLLKLNRQMISVLEDIEWLHNAHRRTLRAGETTDWIRVGPRTTKVICETLFCNPLIMSKLFGARHTLKRLDKGAIASAIVRSNPYEKLGDAGFVSRGAAKMASINAACDFMFTSQWLNELLYFADLCAGPGGFSEYILSRTGWHAKGFGFTLRNAHDFRLDDFRAASGETLHPFYGPENTGDIRCLINQQEFKALVMKHTSKRGVHFVMSDGGLSEDEELVHENTLKQLYVCQCLTALAVLMTGGHFVLRMHELYSAFGAGIVYLMYRCFDNICIFKPNSSRASNTERYLICKSKKDCCEPVTEYLSQINGIFISREDNITDVLELVPLDVLKADDAFVTYLKHSNDALGMREIMALLKLVAFADNPSLTDPTQNQMLEACSLYLELLVENETPKQTKAVTPGARAREILQDDYANVVGHAATRLTVANIMETVMHKPYDWYCTPCATGRAIDSSRAATLYLGMDGNRVFRYVKGEWESVGELKLELPADTLVYAEFLQESRWTGTCFVSSPALHILDAYMLGGQDVSWQYITTR